MAFRVVEGLGSARNRRCALPVLGRMWERIGGITSGGRIRLSLDNNTGGREFDEFHVIRSSNLLLIS